VTPALPSDRDPAPQGTDLGPRDGLPHDDDQPWHALGGDEVVERLATDPECGLTEDEARERLATYGPNRLEEEKATPWWVTLVNQFRSPLIYILMLAGVLTIALGEFIDAGVIAAVLALNASIGFVQERRAERSVRALMQLVSPTAHLVRDGREMTIDSEAVVPGDIVLLESGVRVAADVRLLWSWSLEIDESLLTGESVAVEKSPERVDADVVLADRTDMGFSGATVTRGRGRGVVVRTGAATELGRIAEQVRSTEELQSPLQERMRRFAHIVGAVIGASALLTFVLGLLLGEDPGDMLLVSAALAVAAIPEGLPVVLTVVLVRGVRPIARRNAIIRQLSAVETLGSTTLIGSDKTGTLTENRMTIRELWVAGERYDLDERRIPTDPRDADRVDPPGPDDRPLALALLAGVLANESFLEITDEGVRTDGDPTETAFLVAAARHGFDPQQCRELWAETARIPFESDHRFAATFVDHDGEAFVFVKGAPERVLEMCTSGAGLDGNDAELDPDAIEETAHAMAGRGLRVLGTAFGRLAATPGDRGSPPTPEGLTFLGLHGLLDPPRQGVAEAIAGCQRAGQRVIMITGDHAATARAIAKNLGIVADDDAPVLTGRDLDDLDDQQLQDRVAAVSVFARVSPEHKLRIVRAARGIGHVVAVTGDGVNDAPALKNADIGIAMGVGGTDVAREAADIVLADDNFVSIYAAVEQGRVTFENVRKVTFFLVSTGFGTFIVIPIAMVFDWPLIMVPAQLLWANLVTKGLQDLALAFEPAEPDVLDHPPRGRGDPVITAPLWWRTLFSGGVIAIGTLVLFDWARDQPDLDLDQARAIALTTLVVFQAFHLGSSRSELRSVLQVSPLSNRFLIFAQLGALAVHIGALYLPATQFILRVEPFPISVWLLIVPVAATVLVVVELDKWVRRRRRRQHHERARLEHLPAGN
jgi:magnesium-transporting ATPase (P-type)